jgi:acyl carrier protein
MNVEQTRDTDSEYSSHTDRTLAALWTEVLNLASPPLFTDNFFSLGGDSMAAVTLEFRVHEELSVLLPPGTLFGAPTLRELSLVVNRLTARTDAPQGPATLNARPSVHS